MSVPRLHLLSLPLKYFTKCLSQFWSTVVAIELTDIVFSIDSILAAVGLSQKVWVVITGGVLGIIAMRFVAGGFLRLIEVRPALIEGAFIIVGWIGTKLILAFLYQEGVVGFLIPKEVTYGVIVIVFVASFLAKRNPPPAVKL